MERFVHSPYGVLTINGATWANTRSASSYTNAYTVTGRQLDTETRLYNYRARLLHAQLGRFAGRDPLSYLEGELALYEYAFDAPVNFSDAFGLQPGHPGSPDSVSRTIWHNFLTGNWRAAIDLIDDMLSYVKNPAHRSFLQTLRQAAKQMENLEKWRRQMSNWSRSQRLQQLKTLEKTLERHLKKRCGQDTPETLRIRYQIEWLKKILDIE